MSWKLNSVVSLHGMAYYITGIMVDNEHGLIQYTLRNVDLPNRFLTVVGKAA